MERKGMNGPMSPRSSADSGAYPRSLSPPPTTVTPPYRCATFLLTVTPRSKTLVAASRVLVPDALEHLASIDLIDLCKEAKVERCRAARDLRSCGRDVKHVLNSCGHASLCAECSQRFDVCPICRIPIPKTGDQLRLRLYYECIQAGLISRQFEERFQEQGDGENELNADVERLYSIFDVALENGLASLICHYVTDVCMDENAVSSDPVIAFLLDEVVVKDWCKLTFRNIIKELQQIYNLEVEEMNSRLSSLIFSVRLAGISNILEVLGASFKNSLSAKLDDLQHLHESILKTKQHIEIMMWCIRHHFLENARSHYTNFESWESLVRERKSAAIKRSWYDAVNHDEESNRREGSLFIEDALVNLEIDQGHVQEMGEVPGLASLQKDGDSLFLRSKIEGLSGCYPFENLRGAVDMLFLHGSSDLVVAKQAIFLYYLFDRHYTLPDEGWRDIVDDFATTFGVSRHSLLESFTFYLLDDHTDKALQEACDILLEICGSATTHPKIAQVLLERQMPETALMVLRWSGRDGGSQLVTLDEAVTGVRLRVECGLLTEAFMHQRMLCTEVRDMKLKYASSGDPSNELKDGSRSWLEWMNILVAEICCLCIRRNLVDRIIEMPWNSEEEKYLHECLLNHAIDDPSTTTGSLLVVYYLQRYRYAQACQVDHKLQSVEQDFIISRNSDTEIVSGMRSVSHWRAGLVDKCIRLLPEVLRNK
ncbi:E3 ubiquitin-protein ligase HOS1-like [Tripterygium wilfordii]|uniref:E3 ubiquitin-protein ligase HOS1-like n=1 Tax=Tripterygium wilfordii TaxID=458696 RepID=A0A7J7CLJ7_TRIWF|nr:E3 ubiquitin-protein ligase HOS1-like [Tripterygium wilfordii]